MQIIDSFDLSAKKFLDTRQLWDSLADLEANVATLMPVGFLAYCKAEQQWYQLKSATDEADPTTYIWQLQQTDSVAIQVSSLPVITEDEEEKLSDWAGNTFYQYTGATNNDYTYGYFYKLDTVASPKVVKTLETDVVTEDTENSTYIHSLENKLGDIVVYTNDAGVTSNYKLVAGANTEEPYVWEITTDEAPKYFNWSNVSVSDNEGQVIQVGSATQPVPVANILNEGRIVQYVGNTNSTMRTGYFYKSTNTTFKAYNDSEATNPAQTIYLTDAVPSKSTHFYLKNNDGTFGNIDLTYTVKQVLIDGETIKITYSDGTDDYEGEFTADTSADETVYAWKQLDTQAAGEDREALLKTDLVASVDVGGIEEGTTIKEDAPLETILRKILCPATPPEFTFTGTPAAGLYELGTSISAPQLTLAVTKLGNSSSRKYKIVKLGSTSVTVYTDGTDFYNADATSTTEPSGTAGTPTTIGTATKYDNKLYIQDGSDWKEVDDLENLTGTNIATDTTEIETNGVLVTIQSVVYISSEPQDVVTETPLELTTYNHNTSDNITNTLTYTAIATYTDDDSVAKTVNKNVTYEFVNASYHGIVDTATPDADAISALTKTLSKTKGYTWTGITMTNQRMCYAYPASYGTLSKIIDENNFTVTSSFNVADVTINGIAYKAYTTKDTSTLSNGKLIFE